MIRTLTGKFYPQPEGTAVIETAAGIGFLIVLASNSPLYRHYEGEEVKVFTLMTVGNDELHLYGFDSMEELNLFKLLTTVSGVGAKAAMAILSILPCEPLKRAIAQGDADMLTQASGVGKRTAQRVILELKDKVDYIPAEGGAEAAPRAFTNERKEAVDALVALGYSRTEAQDAVGKVAEEGQNSEEYIRLALRNLL